MKGDAVQLAAKAQLVPQRVRQTLAAKAARRIEQHLGGSSMATLQGAPPLAQHIILLEVALERVAQDAKWGQQDHPLVDPLLAERVPSGAQTALRRMAQEYEVPMAGRAKFLTDVAARRGNVTFAHIASEEQSEWIEAATLGDLDAARQEAIQAAAVWVQVVERIDRMRLQERLNVLGKAAREASGVPDLPAAD